MSFPSEMEIATSDIAATEADPTAPTPRMRRGNRRVYTRRFLRNKSAVVGLVIFAVLTLFALFGELTASFDYLNTDFLSLTSPPGANGHWWGTNNAGNDLYAQTAHGLQRSLLIAVLVSVGTTVLSAIVGATAAYYRGRYERVTLAVIHFLMVIPSFLVLALVSNSSGGDWFVISMVLIAVSWFFSARTIWTMALSVREREYVQAARYMGVPGFRIVLRHIIPNIGSYLVIQFTLGMVGAVLAETSLSFLGFGIKAPDVSLGALIGSGANTVYSAPWLFYFPAVVLTLLTASMALVADGLRDALDPTSKSGGSA